MSDALAVGRRVLQVEAEALAALSASLNGSFVQAVDMVARLNGRLALTGIGKSGHVARKIAATLASTGTPALFVHPAEASHGDLGMIGAGDAVLALSKSGETRELADVIGHAKRFGLPLIGMTTRPDSALGRAADLVLRLPEAAEATEAVDAPTTSTTLQMALGDALAVAVMERRGFGARDFRAFHPGGALGAALTPVSALMHTGAELPLAAAETPMRDALLLMTEKRFGCVGVCDAAGALIGVVTDGDLRRHMGPGLLDALVETVMTGNPKTIRPDQLATEALGMMSSKIAVLIVAEAGTPVGIIKLHDLLRAGVA